MKDKAQSSIEFMVLIGAVLFFFIVLLFSLHGQNADKFFENRNNAVKEIAVIVQSEINLAATSSDGYGRNFKLPLDALGVKYNASIQDNLVYVATANNKHAIALPVRNVTGQPKIGDNLIRKQNNSVFLNS